MAPATETTPLHTVAEEWAGVREKLDRAEDEIGYLQRDAKLLREQLTTLSEQLQKAVGDNVTERAFEVGVGAFVMVERQKCIRLIRAERKAEDR